ncbi:MAG: DUF3365 domain-containing protein [Bacillota bacterium]
MSRHNLSFRFMLATTLIIVSVMAAHFLWEHYQLQRQAYAELKEKAQVITLQLLATREFISQHQDRINYDSLGNFEFKGLNPAAVGTGVNQIFGRWTDYTIKQTRLNTRNPLNEPDQFERAVLLAYEETMKPVEVWDRQEINGKHYFRYIRPLFANESCLPCHGEPAGKFDIAGYPREGYELGEYAGAISVMIPMDSFIANLRSNSFRQLGFTLLLLGFSLTTIFLLINFLVGRPLDKLKMAAVEVGRGNLQVDIGGINAQGEIKELAIQFKDMADQLGVLYDDLEGEVEKRTEELTLANEKLSALNVHKSQFLATMSHELRTPLTSIIAFAELLEEQLPEKEGINHQNIEEIKKNGEQLLVLINDLLDLAQIEAGRYQLHLETMDLVDVIESVERLVAPIAQKKAIDFSSTFLAEVPLFRADPEKIRRAVLNLADNAVKFTPHNGKVEIVVDFDEADGEVIIKVIDTGIGISTEGIPYLFERFRQLDSSNARRYRGSGLGLALTKELLEMHGGWIKVDSKLEEGSTFILGLPIGNFEFKKEGEDATERG